MREHKEKGNGMQLEQVHVYFVLGKSLVTSKSIDFLLDDVIWSKKCFLVLSYSDNM